jgi:hypothetical protein
MCSCAALQTEDTRARLDEYTNATAMASADEFVFFPDGQSTVQNLTWGLLLTEFQTDTSAWDFSGDTVELPNSTSLPGSCDAGDVYVDTDASSGQQLYICESGSWVLSSGAGTSEITSATPLLEFNDTDAAGAAADDEEAVRLNANMGTTTEDAEDADFWIEVMQDGTRTEVLRFDESDDWWEFVKNAYFQDDIYYDDDNFIIIGDSYDWYLGYDETTDDQLELYSNSGSDTTFSIFNIGAGDAILEVDQISAAGIPVFDLVDSELNDTSTPHLLTTAELKNTLINSYNATPEAKEYDFPVANEGWMFTVVCGTTSNITLDPNGTEQWTLNGTAASAGEALVNEACTVGESITCFSLETGASTYSVFCESKYTDWEEDTP